MKKMNFKRFAGVGLAAMLAFASVPAATLMAPITVMADEVSVPTASVVLTPETFANQTMEVTENVVIKLTSGTYTNVAFSVRNGVELTLVYEDGVILNGGNFSSSAYDYGKVFFYVNGGIVNLYGADASATITAQNSGTGIFFDQYYDTSFNKPSIINVYDGNFVVKNMEKYGIYARSSTKENSFLNVIGSGAAGKEGVRVTKAASNKANYKASFVIEKSLDTGICACDNAIFHFDAKNAYVAINNNTQAGVRNDDCSEAVSYTFTDSCFITNNNGTNGAVVGDWKRGTFTFERSYYGMIGNGSHGNNGGNHTYVDSFVEAKNNGGSALRVVTIDTKNSILELDGNKKYGLEIHPNVNGYANLVDSNVTINVNKNYGVFAAGNVTVDNTNIIVNGNGKDAIYLYKSAVLTFDGQGNSVITADGEPLQVNGEAGSYHYVANGSLYADRADMVGTYVMNRIPDGLNTMPVNAFGTLLNRFTLTKDLDSFQVLDPNAGKEYTYSYDLDPEGNAYVWAPVGVISYDATEGTVSALGTAMKGAAELVNKSDANAIGNATVDFAEATDYTILGNNLSLTNAKIPTVTKEGFNTVWKYVPSTREKANAEAQKLAAAGDFEALYALLAKEGVEFTANTALNDEYVIAYATFVPVPVEKETEVEADEETTPEATTETTPETEKETEVETDEETIPETEAETEEETVKNPEVEADVDVATADRAYMILYVSIALVASVAAISIVLVSRRKKSE